MASISDEVLSQNSAVDLFCSVTGSYRDEGLRLLEACEWNLEMAINMHMDRHAPSSPVTQNSLSTSSVQDGNPSSVDSDNVRAPIPPTRGVLVEPDYNDPYDFRGMLNEFQEEFGTESFGPSTMIQRKTFEDHSPPPVDLIHRGSFESARKAGQVTKKWLLVNIQNTEEASSQVLNRDVWSSEALKDIISENFVFWQVYSDSSRGQKFMQFYRPVMFPYIAVIDPWTGENLAIWNYEDSNVLHRVMVLFLNNHVMFDESLSETDDDELDYQLDEEQEIETDDEEQEIETDDEDSQDEAHVDSSKLETLDSEGTHNDVNRTENTIEHQHEDTDKLEDWKAYLGSESGDTAKLVIRLPDGEKVSVTWPSSTKLKALILYSESLGFNQENYELVTNFPRKSLRELPLDKTLKELGLYPREMLFLQLKDGL